MPNLAFPFAVPPVPGRPLDVAPGILWLRLPLPFRLNHVNVYLLDGPDGWTIVDAGVDDAATRLLWDEVFDTTLRGKPVKQVLVTHYHPDHVGAAAMLCARTGAPLLMGEIEYLTARVHLLAAPSDTRFERPFYRVHGLDAEQLAFMAERLVRYRHTVPALPQSFVPLRTGAGLDIGGRRFGILSCAGHSPGQILLHADRDVLLAADHVLPQISPNVSVAEDRPDDDPLGLYLQSFPMIRRDISDDVLVLPGHRLPFRGLHERTRALERHHAERCALILDACTTQPPTAADLVPILFPIELDAHQFWFAFSETLAHLNYLACRGRLRRHRDGEVIRWSGQGEPG